MWTQVLCFERAFKARTYRRTWFVVKQKTTFKFSKHSVAHQILENKVRAAGKYPASPKWHINSLMNAATFLKLKIVLFQYCLLASFFLAPQSMLFPSILRSLQALPIIVMICSQPEQCITDAKTKSETQKCACLKNAIKTCKAFLTKGYRKKIFKMYL